MPRRVASKRRRPPTEAVLARRAERRQHLLDVADRVVQRDGPEASINQIAAEAGIAKPILYRHFGDKGGLYQALAERYVQSLMARLRDALREETAPRARLAATIDAYLGFVEDHPEMYQFLMHRAVPEQLEAHATVADFIRQVAAEVAVVLGEELRRAGMDSGGAEPWAHGIVGMVQLAGDWWLRNRSMPRQRLVEYLTTLLWNGFAGMTDTPASTGSSGVMGVG
ncbi:MAG: TetR/AcrR family transcriptional regulator [Actinomycetota bacterium]|nr:TetR/AcrR family transcriptional regulator [Actinomycetota bacterium]